MKCSEVNEMLDRLMDDDLSDSLRRELEDHAQNCPQCAEIIKATIEMKALLTDMDEEADVPLEAQVAWRRAVKQEASKRKTGKIYRWIGTCAAAVVLIAGIGFAFNADNITPADKNNNALVVAANHDETSGIAMIESDGGNDVAMAKIVPEPTEVYAETEGAAMKLSDDMVADSAYATKECILSVDDIESASGYISDLVAEYEGNMVQEPIDGNTVKLYITIPSENIEAFMSAAAHLDKAGDAFAGVTAASIETTNLLLILNS